MAKSRLQEDELNWILSVDASQAQQELRKVEKDSKTLGKANKDLRQRMIDLIAAGKKESEEYRNLDKAIKSNNKLLKDNKERTERLGKQIGLTSLTMNQLRKKAKELQLQLNNTSKSLDPDSYKRLSNELMAVHGRMDELRIGGARTGKSLQGSFLKISTAVKGFMALGLVSFLKNTAVQAFNTRKEFAKYETVLRTTLQSEDKASQAMAMLKRLAKETPFSLAEVTDAFVKMVNRGVQPTQTELVRLGDIAASQGKSLDQLIEALLDAQTGEFERLKEFGIKASKQGDKVTFSFKGVQTQVAFTDKAITDYIYSLGELKGVQGGMIAQMQELGGVSSNLSDTWDNLYNIIGKKLEPLFKGVMGSLSDVLSQISNDLLSANERFNIQVERVATLDTQLPPLLDKYDKLKAKTTLTADEQNELNLTMAAIGQLMPGVITGFDQYGNALDINREKLKEFLEAEKLRLQYLNEDQIASTRKSISHMKGKMARKQAELNAGGTYTFGSTTMNPYGRSEIAAREAEIRKLGQMIAGAEEELKRLTGTSLEERVNNQQKQMASGASSAPSAAASGVSSGKGDPHKAQLAKLEAYLTEEKTKIQKSYLDKEVDKAAYDKRMQEIEMEGLTQKMEIYELDKEKQMEVLETLQAYKIKLMDELKKHEEETLSFGSTMREQDRQQKAEEANMELQQIKSNNIAKEQAEFQHQQQMKTIVSAYASEIGSMVGGALSGNEDMVKSALTSIINMALDALAIQAKVAVAQATVQSFAQADSVLTFGAAGFARAAILTGLIEAAVAAVKGLVGGLINRIGSGSAMGATAPAAETFRSGSRVIGREDGGFMPVQRAQDGKTYQAAFDPWKRGYVSRPTVLVGDGPAGRSREWVASNDALQNPTVAPIIDLMDRAQRKGSIRTIDMNQMMRSRMAGFEKGGYMSSASTPTGSADNSHLDRIYKLFSKLSQDGLKAYVVYRDIEKKKETMDTIHKLGGR